MVRLVARSILAGIFLSILATAAFASDTTKYNPKGSNPLDITTFHNVTSDRVAYLKGEVDAFAALSITRRIREMSRSPKLPAYLVIDSPGGSIMAGIDIIDAIRGAKAQTGLRVTAIITGLAASMAAVIAINCDTTYTTEYGVLMFHRASYGVGGDQDQVLSRVRSIDAWLTLFEKRVAKQLGMPFARYCTLRNSELWLNATEQVAFGYVDGFVSDFFVLPDADPTQTAEEIVISTFNWGDQ